ncbi:MAG: peroxiredoxin [Rubrobacteraceae bacterium]
MTRSDNIYQLPADLPVPLDDGACDHLPGAEVPSVGLMATSGVVVDLASLSGTTVVYCYPLTGRPNRELPEGWDQIPGARGCTPQSCSFRDHHGELQALGTRVFGMSAQDTEYQREAKERLELPFDLLSDENLVFTNAIGLPTFEVDGMTLIKRLTLIIDDGGISKVFYPVFPPDKSAEEAIEWLPRTTS